MARSLARRQFWIVVLLAAVAYLWWRSLEPDRYAEFPADPDGESATMPTLADADPEA